MSEADERIALLQQGVDAFNRGDPNPALTLFADDVECFISGELMNAGTYRGHDGYLEMIENWSEAWESVTAHIVATEDLPNDHLLVDIDQSAVGAGSGVPVEMTIYWLFQFVGGEVTRFHMYASRERAVAAARD